MIRAISLLAALLMLSPGAALGERDHVNNWYEVFVYSYQDGNGDGIGDLRGLLRRLDYIEDMGYNGLWLMPVMPSPSYHKYDVTDYKAIDAQYGTLEDFRALADACRERGIELIVDLPVNHTSVRHPWFISACEALRSGEMDHPYIDYYCFRREAGMKYVPVAGTDWHYEEQFSGGGMPDLNLQSEAVRGEIRSILDFWLNECGVDGFRLDAVTSYFAQDIPRNVEFLRWLKQTVEALKPGAYLVGEAWTGMTDIAAYYQSGVDSFFLFPVSQAEGYIAKTIRARSKPAQTYMKYMQEIQAALGGRLIAPFIGNHDTGRAVGSLQARSVPARAKFAEALVNLLGGATFTYYGEEIGMVGSGEDPNKRLAMYWSEAEMTAQPPGVTKVEYAYPSVEAQLADEGSLLHYCRALNHLKLRVPSIARGENEFVYSDGDLLVMRRTWREETSYIAVNFSSKKTHEYRLAEKGLALAGALDATDTPAQQRIDADGAQLTLPPYAVVVLVQQGK